MLNNPAVEKIVAIERAKGDAVTIEDIREYVGGVYPRVMQDGDMDAGAWSCGMVAGLIHDIPSCKDLIEGMMAEADSLIRNRLTKFLAA